MTWQVLHREVTPSSSGTGEKELEIHNEGKGCTGINVA